MPQDGRMVDVAVIGAGIAGVSVAYELSATCTVTLLEQEGQPAFHTTGRSAAMFLETYGGPQVRALTRASRPLFDRVGTLLRRRPMLWVGAAADRDAQAALQEANPGLRALDDAEAGRSCPVLRPEWRTGALLEPGASEIDVLGLHQHYLGGARRRGVRVLLRAPVTAGRRVGGRWRLDTGAGPVEADLVVNAAGAWADRVAATLGASTMGLRPLRRTAAIARTASADPAWPLVSHVREQFYFRTEGRGLLISPGDETPSEPVDAKPDELGVALALERINEATTLGLRSIATAWAGLRTFAPDRNPVVGPDPVEPAMYWLAGQGGFGIQTAPALAVLAAGLVTGAVAQPPAELAAARFDGSAAGPAGPTELAR
jgi:D-arginine dehydrogenase